ncbi:MAG: hypothetical protein HYT63_01925 [Candidatus Yanofskybacteria bacterium]|nr:hypothetical protein [Candidatus Yanofskybacteria bacterium]
MSNQKLINRIKIILPAFILAVFVFSAPKAHAFLGISIANEVLSTVILYLQGIVMGFIGTVLAWTAYALGWFLKFQGGFFEDVAIVKTSWEVFRNFANMFFILILIIIAFATIFDAQNYNWKGLMAKFIIAALLINFSLAIGGFLIDVSTNLSNLMLSQLGDITSNLAGGFGITKIGEVLTTWKAPKGDSGTLFLGTIISMSGTIIVAVVALLAMLAALIFSMVRVPILWALLIVSPIAWISYILPSTRQTWSKWWSWFIGWTFFLPMYLFALMMGFVILKNRPDLGAAALLAEQEGTLTKAGNLIGFGFQDIFYYTLTLIILIGGLAASLKASFAAGSGATKVFGNISGSINNWAKRKTGVAAFQKKGKEKWEELQKTGLPGKLGFLYGGERAEKLKEAKVGERFFGEKGAVQEEKDRALREDIKKYKDRFKATTDVEELRNNSNTGPDAQKLAIRELLKERGELRPDEAIETYKLYGGNRSRAGIEFAKDYEYDKLSREERQQMYNIIGIENAEIARKIAVAQAEKGDWRGEEGEELTAKLERLANLFSQTGEKRDFLDKVKKFNFEESIKAMVNLNLTQEKDFIKEEENQLKKMNIDKLAELSAVTLKKLIANERTARVISDKVTKDTASTIAGKLAGDQLEAFEDIIAAKKNLFANEEVESQAKTFGPLTQKLDELIEVMTKQSKLSDQSPSTVPLKLRGPAGFVQPKIKTTPEEKKEEKPGNE